MYYVVMEVRGIHPDYEIDRIGIPEVGEWIVTSNGVVQATTEDITFIADSYPVAVVTLRKKWHKARRDRHKPPMLARFRDYKGRAWIPGTLVAYAYGTHKYRDQNGQHWRMCEVFY